MLYDRVRRGHPDTRELKKAADALWEDPGIINEFIEVVEEQADIDEDDRRILEGWCHPLTGFFVLERHLSRSSIFIDTEADPSGETFSCRSNPERLSEFALSRRGPKNVTRSKVLRQADRDRRAGSL